MVKKTTPRTKTTRSRTTKATTTRASATKARSTTTKAKTTKSATKTKRKTAAPKPAAAPKVEKASVVVALGKRQLIDKVVETSGIKKKAAKPVIEAVLKELGDALSRGETLNLQPFGKAIVKNTKDLANAEIVELRLRRSKLAIKAAKAAAPEDTPTPPKDPLAEAAE